MLQTRVIPCLLLDGARVVKTVKFKNPVYVGDPINVMRIFNEKEVDEIVVLDIAAPREDRAPAFALIGEIASECFMPLSYGGGVRSLDDMRKLLASGVEKIIINTAANDNAALIRAGAREYGSQSVVVSVDVKRTWVGRYETHVAAGRRSTGLDPVTYAKRMEELGAGEILLNSIDRDGTMQGYDLALIRSVADAVNVPVIACGGARTTEDLRQAIIAGHASAACAGSMFVFHGRHRAVLITYPDTEELRRVLTHAVD